MTTQTAVLDRPALDRPGPVGAGQPPEWDDIVRRHAAPTYRLAYRLSGNREDAEDLTQETFIRVFRALDRYEPQSFEGWLKRITTNLFLDLVRRRRHGIVAELPADLPEARPVADPVQEFHRRHIDVDVERALDRLSPDFRIPVVLRDLEDLGYEEIAAALGLKPGTVRSRVFRGRAALRAMLTDGSLR